MDEKLGSQKQFCVFQNKEKSGNIGLFIPKRICLRQFIERQLNYSYCFYSN